MRLLPLLLLLGASTARAARTSPPIDAPIISTNVGFAIGSDF